MEQSGPSPRPQPQPRLPPQRFWACWGLLRGRALTLPPWPVATSSEAGEPSARPCLLPPFSWGWHRLSRLCQLRQPGSPRLPPARGWIAECPAPAPRAQCWAAGTGHAATSQAPVAPSEWGDRAWTPGRWTWTLAPPPTTPPPPSQDGRRTWGGWKAPSTPPGPPSCSPTCVGTEVRGRPATWRLLGVPRVSEWPQTQPTEPAVPGGAAFRGDWQGGPCPPSGLGLGQGEDGPAGRSLSTAHSARHGRWRAGPRVSGAHRGCGGPAQAGTRCEHSAAPLGAICGF